jgi:hypothetical protein
MTSSRRRAALLVVLLAVVINLPLLHSRYQEQRVSTSGTDVTATVVDDRVVNGDQYWLSFTFPEDVDPDQRTWQSEVDQEAYDDAVASGEITVRVLEDDPSAYRAEGTVANNLPLVVTLVADLLLLLIALLLWRYGGPRRAQLRAVALEDVERCPPETLLERIHGEDYLIRGDVLAREDGSVTLDLGNRSIVVLLDGHANPVGHQQSAQVRARMIG